MRNHSHLVVAPRLRVRTHSSMLIVTIREGEERGICSATLKGLLRIVTDQVEGSVVDIVLNKESSAAHGTSLSPTLCGFHSAMAQCPRPLAARTTRERTLHCNTFAPRPDMHARSCPNPAALSLAGSGHAQHTCTCGFLERPLVRSSACTSGSIRDHCVSCGLVPQNGTPTRASGHSLALGQTCLTSGEPQWFSDADSESCTAGSAGRDVVAAAR